VKKANDKGGYYLVVDYYSVVDKEPMISKIKHRIEEIE